MPFTERYFNQLVLIKNKNSWLKNLFCIVIDNLDNESFSIENLSKQLYMSSSNLNRKVKKTFGFTTLKLIRDLRLQYASELLNTKNISVTEVSYLTGFYDAAHLSRYFKPVFGCSPGEYRNIYPFFKCLESLKEIETNSNVK
ncbi:helix-turn-helix domain-containing protein [Tenacibaculum aiptasiae]|uniref:helix-turn-helix domain-containing protein n=1 Tax=Tenacibaculum aiptasiae TaxID=426481 RepID=UPI002492FB51|nr:AraC family transcriptional regulator [Tenacibaculum aiptasiae]